MQTALFASYDLLNRQLAETREFFHAVGRLEDSNAKLDEIAKIFSIYFAFRRRLISKCPGPATRQADVIGELQDSFSEVARLPALLDSNGRPLFGHDARLNLEPGDEQMAAHLLRLVMTTVDSFTSHRQEGDSFDALNEIFGHFVRDNFRSNIEDAQYMTPPEVVDFMSALAIRFLQSGLVSSDDDEELIVVDPCCGVGSFLASFYHRAKQSGLERHIRLVGQDKVQRMARLSAINLLLFDKASYDLSVGNSLAKQSNLMSYNGRAHIVLTNPPFGARFLPDAVASFGQENLPFFASALNRGGTIDSELLFVDRDLALLRDGGMLLIVVPDGVVSARGTAAMLRSDIARTSTVRGIVELPPVTFAQAGTRTRTAILIIQKGRKNAPTRNRRVFLAEASHLGFEVSTRKGVNLKRIEGENDLLAVEAAFHPSVLSGASAEVIRETPPSVALPEKQLYVGAWTPKHHSPARLSALNAIAAHESLVPTKLENLVEIVDNLRPVPWRPDSIFIGVLHVIGEGLIDIEAVRLYQPKTAGLPVKPGDILLSKINPRIPRVCVVPNLGPKMICSSEFEVMRARHDDPYLLSFLLLGQAVQDQITNLTSGTSASHNRIRTSDLREVIIPMPRPRSASEKRLKALIARYRAHIGALTEATVALADIRLSETSWM